MKKFEITNINFTVLHHVQSANGKPLPGYTKLVRVSVYIKLDRNNYRYTFYMLWSQPIDQECSDRTYYSQIKDAWADEIYCSCDTQKKLEEWIEENKFRG